MLVRIFIFILLLPHLSLAQKKVEDLIRALDKQRFEAQVKKDTVFLEKVLANDLVYHHSNGFSENKRDFIRNISLRHWNYTSIDVEEALVRVYRNTAVVTGRARMVLLQDDKPTPLRILYTEVYVKQRWLWQLTSWSGTRIGEKGE